MRIQHRDLVSLSMIWFWLFRLWVCDPVNFGSDSPEAAVVLGKDNDEALKTVTAGEPETSHHI